MHVVSFDQVNIQMQNYFVDQKYQFLKSNPLENDFTKKNLVKSERFEIENKNSLRKQDIAKKKKKKNKVEKQKWLAEKRKNQHEICQISQRKKIYQDHNFESS